MLVYDKFYRAYEAKPVYGKYQSDAPTSLAPPDPEDANVPETKGYRDFQKTIAPIPNTTSSHISEQFRKLTEKIKANPVMAGVVGLVAVIILWALFGRRRRR